jgi:uncharacterized repeat protein (TIGR03803 family)
MMSNWSTVTRIPVTRQRAANVAMALTIMALIMSVATESLQAQTLTVRHAFNGSPDGFSPWAAPIQDSEGNFYGTTWAGGTLGFGTIYEVDSSGKETTLHNFAGGKDGSNPWAVLTMDAAGNLYGTTNSGGGAYCFNNYGCGIVFKLSHGTQGWKETILYAFKGGSDGANPGYGALALDTAGNLYGTTIYGGTGYCSTGCGTVFKLTHTSGIWQEQLLHTFTALSQTDGATPHGGLVLDAAGNVYGTTSIGGNSSCGCGTVYKLDAIGGETILYSFQGGADGAEPFASLVRDKLGNLYGTTLFGGNNLNYGTVFELDANGTETPLHIFAGYPTDGGYPYAPLVRDGAGNLYGTTYIGGNSSGGGFCETNNQPQGCGTVFRVAANGQETILYNFSYYLTGAETTAGVILDAKGQALYGATAAGGPSTNRGGDLFKLGK